MSTTEDKNNSVERSGNIFSTNKLFFQSRVSTLLTLSDLLRRSDEPFEDEGPAGSFHCLHCQRAGFGDGGVTA